MSHKNHIHLLSDIGNSQYTTHVYEITHHENLEQNNLSTLLGDSLQNITHNLEKKTEERKKTMFFYFPNKTIVLFFPNIDELSLDRSEFFSTIEDKTIFIPSQDIPEAYETIFLGTYAYQKYLSKKKKKDIALFVQDQKMIEELQKNESLYESIFWARDLINMPPNDATPHSIVRDITDKKWNHFDVHVFDKKSLQDLGCNLLLAVGAGSANHPYMVILTPKNPPKTEKFALVGKGVTFDAGGIQIKPDTAMLDMKCDMSGAAGMMGVARYLDTLPELPVNVIIAIGLTENMTGDEAFKPLDIYTAYNGTTVEIHHTDAEGRLVLADVMSYVEKNYKPEHIITMATLTGACIYALGHDISGIMGDDDVVIGDLIAHENQYEKLWRLPLNDKFKKSLKAEIADIKNVARSEKAGSSIGGAFLSYFQGNAKLTHIDIAGPAYRESVWGYMPKGGTGWGVKILSEFLLSLPIKLGK